MAIEQEIHSMQGERGIRICPPTTFGELLSFDGNRKSQQALAKAKVHILQVPEEGKIRYLALVDLKLRKNGLGRLLHDVSPYGRAYRDDYSKHGFNQRHAALNDWEMPDIQGTNYPYSARLLRIHQAAFPIEWTELEKDRKLLMETLEGREVLFPLISWNVDSNGVRNYDLSTVSPELFVKLRELLKFGHKLQTVLLTSSNHRTFNPNVGLVAAAFLQPELYEQWSWNEPLPLKKNEDYKGERQTMSAAQVPLLVLWRKNQILAGKPFDAMEDYANS